MTKQEMLIAINEYDIAYYENNAPLISDHEYDQLRQQFISLYGAKDLNYIPSDEINGFTKRKHDFLMMSLEKIKQNDREEIKKYFEKYNNHVILQPKIDGLTLVDYGNNIRVSRGNGIQGDILPLAKYINMGSAPGYVVRGEAFLTKKVFRTINASRLENSLPLFENARNAAAGILHNLDDCKYYPICFLAYEIRKRDKDIATRRQSYLQDLTLLKHFGYDTPETWEFTSFEDLMTFIDTFDKNCLEYDIDGLVMKCCDENSYEKYGVTAHHPKDSIAIKFRTERAITTLISVEWSIGRTKITPVAIISPVKLGGTTVSRASIHNCDWIKDKHLAINAKVVLEKANEIIPQIVSVETPGDTAINIPTYCPSCGEPLQYINNQLSCSNEACKGKIAMHIRYIASKPALDIRGLSSKTAEKIINSIPFHSWHDIFLLTKESLMTIPGFQEKSAQKLILNIQKAKQHVPLDVFIYCLGADHIGKMTAKLIANHVKNYEGLIEEVERGCETLSSIKGIGINVAKSLMQYLSEIRHLYQHIQPEAVETQTTNKNVLTIVVTGTFDRPRSYWEQLITSKGHHFGTAITAHTDYLLVGKKAGNTKLKAAEKNNVKCLFSEEALNDIL